MLNNFFQAVSELMNLHFKIIIVNAKVKKNHKFKCKLNIIDKTH